MYWQIEKESVAVLTRMSAKSWCSEFVDFGVKGKGKARRTTRLEKSYVDKSKRTLSRMRLEL